MTDSIAESVIKLTRDRGVAVGDLSLTEIADALGLSRSTLIRRIGSRSALDAELRSRGEAGVGRPPAAERIIAAAAGLYVERGVGQVRLEDVAAVADCTVQAIYSQVGGRDALLTAVAHRYSPFPVVARILNDPPDDLASAARQIYQAVIGAVFDESRVLLALIGECLSRPGGAVDQYLRTEYAPQVSELLRVWLRPHIAAGAVRALTPLTLASLFVGPVALLNLAWLASGRPMTETEQDDVAANLADAFVRAVRSDQ